MRQITYRKTFNKEESKKKAEITSRTEDEQSVTSVTKGFQYHVEISNEKHPEVSAPQVSICKEIDSKKNIEKFDFQVDGRFYVSHQVGLLEVHFHHTLHIEIQWKNKIFSPKKSEVLT